MTTNQHHTEYAPPVLRAPSPASSLGTTYGLDQTAFSDSEQLLSQAAFELKWEDKLELRKPRKEEELANQSPLLSRPQNTAEERQLFERIMQTLRREVQQLEENELFEQALLRGSRASLAPQPSTSDIDTLMRSMMGPAMTLNGSSGQSNRDGDDQVSNGPWNNYGLRYNCEAAEGGVSVVASAATEQLKNKNTRRTRNKSNRRMKAF